MSASSPQAMLVGASCTAELIQDDPGGLAQALDLPVPVIPLELPAYQKKENWGAAETFYRLVRALADPACQRHSRRPAALQPSRPHRPGLPPPRRHRGDHRPARPHRDRRRRGGADGRQPRRSRPAGRSGFQRRPVSGDRRYRRPMAATHVPASRPSRPSRSASAPPATSSRKWRRSPGSRCRPSLSPGPRACPGTRTRSTAPT